MAAVLGASAVAVGVGVGVRHLRAGSVWPGGLLGIAVGLAGVALLVLAVVLMARTRWSRTLAAVAVGLGTATVVWVAAPAVAATVVPGTSVGADPGPPYSEVGLPGGDGVELAGWYAPSTTGAAVVLLHGAGSTRSAVLDQAEVLRAHGYGVLLLDARGQGRSSGRAMEWGWWGDADVAAALDHLERRPDVDPDRLAAVGLSMGGEEAVGAIAGESRLRGVVAEGLTARQSEDLSWLSDVHGWRGSVTEIAHAAGTWLADRLTPADPPLPLRDAVAASSTPVLLVVAGTVADEQHAAADLDAAAPDTVSVWDVPGAAHTGGLATDPRGWEREVVAFLDAATFGAT